MNPASQYGEKEFRPLALVYPTPGVYEVGITFPPIVREHVKHLLSFAWFQQQQKTYYEND